MLSLLVEIMKYQSYWKSTKNDAIGQKNFISQPYIVMSLLLRCLQAGYWWGSMPLMARLH